MLRVSFFLILSLWVFALDCEHLWFLEEVFGRNGKKCDGIKRCDRMSGEDKLEIASVQSSMLGKKRARSCCS